MRLRLVLCMAATVPLLLANGIAEAQGIPYMRPLGDVTPGEATDEDLRFGQKMISTGNGVTYYQRRVYRRVHLISFATQDASEGQVLLIGPTFFRHLGSIGGASFFAENTGAIHQTDGTTRGTFRLGGYQPQTSTKPVHDGGVVIDGRLYYFNGPTIDGYHELLEVDPAHRQVRYVTRYPTNSGNPPPLVTLNGLIYTYGYTAGKRGLIAIDPATGTASLILQTTLSSERSLTRCGERLFLSTSGVTPEGSSGTEPWVSDGTPEGTRLVGDFAPGTGSSYPGPFTQIGDSVYFTAPRATAIGLYRFADDEPSLVLEALEPLAMAKPPVVLDDAMYWVSESNGRLYKFEPAKESILALTPEAPPSVNFSGVSMVNGAIYAIARHPEGGNRIYRSAGTAETTVPLIVPQYTEWMLGQDFVAPLGDDSALLLASQPHGGFLLGGLYVDRPGQDPLPYHFPITVPRNSTPGEVAPLGGGRFVYTVPGANPLPSRLMVTSGNDLIELRNEGHLPAVSYTWPTHLAGRVYFIRSETGTGATAPAELWRTDGTPGGTSLVKVLPSNATTRIVPLGDQLAIIHGSETWLSDGTANGTGFAFAMASTMILPVGNSYYIWGGNRLYVWSGNGDPMEIVDSAGGRAVSVSMMQPSGEGVLLLGTVRYNDDRSTDINSVLRWAPGADFTPIGGTETRFSVVGLNLVRSGDASYFAANFLESNQPRTGVMRVREGSTSAERVYVADFPGGIILHLLGVVDGRVVVYADNPPGYYLVNESTNTLSFLFPSQKHTGGPATTLYDLGRGWAWIESAYSTNGRCFNVRNRAGSVDLRPPVGVPLGSVYTSNASPKPNLIAIDPQLSRAAGFAHTYQHGVEPAIIGGMISEFDAWMGR